MLVRRQDEYHQRCESVSQQWKWLFAVMETAVAGKRQLVCCIVYEGMQQRDSRINSQN